VTRSGANAGGESVNLPTTAGGAPTSPVATTSEQSTPAKKVVPASPARGPPKKTVSPASAASTSHAVPAAVPSFAVPTPPVQKSSVAQKSAPNVRIEKFVVKLKRRLVMNCGREDT
jgi:hypothetical protein